MQSHIDAIGQGIRAFESYASVMDIPTLDVPVHVHLFYDAGSFYAKHYNEQGITGDELEQRVEEEVDFWSGSSPAGVAFTGVTGIHGFAVGADDWWDSSLVQAVAIHELTHVYQNRLASQAYPNAPRSHSLFIDWLTEGMAELMVDLVLYPPTWWEDPPDACGVALHEVLERGAEYTTGLLASRLLASKVGARGLYDLYMKIYPNEELPSAMARVLGIDYDDFSDDFERYCADGLPFFEIEPVVDYPASRLPLVPWAPSCNILYPEDVEPPESSQIVTALTNICDFVIAFDLGIYDSVAIVDDDPEGLADLIETHNRKRYDLGGRPIGLAISGVGFATFLTTDLHDVPPSWLVRLVGTGFARLLFRNGTPSLFYEGLGQVIPGLAGAYATRQPYEHSASSRSSALNFDISFDALRWRVSPSDAKLSIAREAVELLLATYGLHKTAMYFAQDEEIDWRVRFESAYGVTPDKFYALYEQHRAAGLPDLPIDLTPFGPVSE